MHYLHIIAVEAEDKEDALDSATEALHGYGDGDVYDWYDNTGGRWADCIFPDEYEELQGSNILCYTEHPEAFKATIERQLGYRHAKLARALETLGKEGAISALSGLADNLEEDGQNATELIDELGINSWTWYSLKVVADILNGSYTTDSYFFDEDSGSIQPSYVYQRIEEGKADRQYLVGIDLHN